MLVTWKLRDRPRRLMSCGAMPPISSPRRRMRAGARPVVAADEVEERRLARAVGADHGVAFACGNGQVDAADDLDRAKALAQAGQFEGGQPSGDVMATPSRRARRRQRFVIGTSDVAARRAGTASHRRPGGRAATTQGSGELALKGTPKSTMCRAVGRRWTVSWLVISIEHAQSRRAPTSTRHERQRVVGKDLVELAGAQQRPLRVQHAGDARRARTSPWR